MSSIIKESVFIPLLPGNPDPNNPGKRTLQKGSTNNQCLNTAMQILTTSSPNSPYIESYPPYSKELADFSINLESYQDSDTRLKTYETFFEKLGKTKKEILTPTLVGALFLNKIIKKIDKEKPLSEKNYKTYLPLYPEKTIETIYHTQLLKLYRDKLNLKVSSFQNKTMDSLIEALKKNGPMLVTGYHGQPYYTKKAVVVSDPHPFSVFGWDPKWRMPENVEDIDHVVIICGAATFVNAKNQATERVYFIDPNDDSNPLKDQARKVYTCSFERFKKSSNPYNLHEIPSTLEEAQRVVYGVHVNYQPKEEEKQKNPSTDTL